MYNLQVTDVTSTQVCLFSRLAMDTLDDHGGFAEPEQEVVYGTSYHPYGKKKALSQYWKGLG